MRHDVDHYYQCLGIPSTASLEDIKKAYRIKALEHHPDRGGLEENFLKIQEAYEKLYHHVQREPLFMTNVFDILHTFFPRKQIFILPLTMEEIYCGTTIRYKLYPEQGAFQKPKCIKLEIPPRNIPSDAIYIDDLCFKKEVKKHALYSWKKEMPCDIYLRLTVSLEECANGFERRVPFLENKKGLWIVSTGPLFQSLLTTYPIEFEISGYGFHSHAKTGCLRIQIFLAQNYLYSEKKNQNLSFDKIILS